MKFFRKVLSGILSDSRAGAVPSRQVAPQVFIEAGKFYMPAGSSPATVTVVIGSGGGGGPSIEGGGGGPSIEGGGGGPSIEGGGGGVVT